MTKAMIDSAIRDLTADIKKNLWQKAKRIDSLWIMC